MIIPCRDSSHSLPSCLEALAQQTMPHENYEVIVVDDGSSDETSIMAERFGVQVVRQEHAGPAAARNRGAKHAKGEILLFTDSDCVPREDWLEEMIRPFQTPGIVGVKGAYRTRQRGLVPRFAQEEFEEKYARLNETALRRLITSQSMCSAIP